VESDSSDDDGPNPLLMQEEASPEAVSASSARLQSQVAGVSVNTSLDDFFGGDDAPTPASPSLGNARPSGFDDFGASPSTPGLSGDAAPKKKKAGVKKKTAAGSAEDGAADPAKPKKILKKKKKAAAAPAPEDDLSQF
jgi:hypothetical protein